MQKKILTAPRDHRKKFVHIISVVLTSYSGIETVSKMAFSLI